MILIFWCRQSLKDRTTVVKPWLNGGNSSKNYASCMIGLKSITHLLYLMAKLGLKDLTGEIEKRSTVCGADIRAVLYSMVEVAAECLEDGTVVRPGGLGSLRMSLSDYKMTEALLRTDLNCKPCT